MKTAATTNSRACDTLALVRQLQDHGIRVLGSTIIGLENHTPENIDEVIDYAVRYEADFHQFMLYTPLHGTPLHAELSAQGPDARRRRLPALATRTGSIVSITGIRTSTTAEKRSSCCRHSSATSNAMARACCGSFARVLNGWQRYKQHPDARIRRRFQREFKDIGPVFAAAVAAARRNTIGATRRLKAKMSALLKDLVQEFGRKSRLYGVFGGSLPASKRSATRNSAWPKAGPTSRPLSTTPTTRPWIWASEKRTRAVCRSGPKGAAHNMPVFLLLMPNRPSAHAMFRRRYRTLRAIVARNGRQNTRTRSFSNGTFQRALTISDRTDRCPKMAFAP